LAIRSETIPLDRLLPDERNPKGHSAENIKRLVSRIQAVGFTAPVLVDAETGILCAGHRRRLALYWLKENHFPEPDGIEPGWGVPARVGTWSELQALQVLLGDNEDPAEIEFDAARLTALLTELNAEGALEGSGYSEERLDALIAELAAGPELPGTGNGTGGVSGEEARRTLAERFGVPPFSVLDARQGYWQTRKRAWIALGIQSELGRGENALGFSEGVNQRHDLGEGPYAKTTPPGQPWGRRADEFDHYRDAEKAKTTGLLGESEQAAEKGLNHYRKGNAPAAAEVFGRGGPGTLDGKRKEWRQGKKDDGAAWTGGAGKGKNSAYLFRTQEGCRAV
jgi:hypothetical protein